MRPEREPMENDSNSRTAEELEQQTVDVYVERALHGPVFRMSYEHTHTYWYFFYVNWCTLIYTARSDEFRTLEGQKKAAATCKLLGLDGIVSIGGDGSFRGLVELAKQVRPSARGELEITDLNRLYLEDDRLKVQLLGRGFAWLDTGTVESLMDAAVFVQTVQNRQDVIISAPEEVAYHMGWLTKAQLLAAAAQYHNAPYGAHLRAVAEDKLVFERELHD